MNSSNQTPSSKPSTAATGPTVKANPDFKKGETLECKSTGSQFKVLHVVEGGYVCEGRAGVMPKEAAQRPLTEEERKSLEAADEA